MGGLGRRWWLPVLAVAMAALCIRLGFWQLDRLEQRRSANAARAAGLAQAPVDVGDALAEPDAAYRPVTATGTYDPTAELVLYGRPLDGRPGDHVLTPLVLGDGTRVLVDRGWVPTAEDADRTVPPAAAPPAGPVTVEGVLVPGEDGDAFGDQDPVGATVIRAVNLDELVAAGAAVAPTGYVLLTAQTPAPATLPVPAPLPPEDEGPHLSYAIQWFAFATIALVGAVIVLRRGRRQAGDQPTQEPAPTANG